MKTNIGNGDAIAAAMDWLGQLREDGRTEPAFEAAGGPAAAATSRPASRLNGREEMRASVEITERAAIGDALRRPIAWCEMDSCIQYFADQAALGEADIHARAIAAGWRVDALGRLACPRCQQSGPWFWTTYPIVLWDRDRAFTMAALMAAAVREDAAGSAGDGAETGVIPAVEAVLLPPPAKGRHR